MSQQGRQILIIQKDFSLNLLIGILLIKLQDISKNVSQFQRKHGECQSLRDCQGQLYKIFFMKGLQVLGRKENCKYVTIFKETAIEQGMEESKFPQNDHLNSTQKDIILNEIMQIGFDIQMQYYVALPITDADKICEAQLNYQSLLRMQLEKAGANEEMIEKVKNAIIQKCKKQLEDTKEPLTVEAFYIIAIKK
eukprot:TRINITY_DN2450_c0_g1_i2.p2 TRINITY_DN2450_c0_g1~~TRINITY_DN2450_c0_g1_i2.p2  ORF type:complete len:194 (-),score=26.17 TRINITY_DN2450_c0_g1_i2:115-696(-)